MQLPVEFSPTWTILAAIFKPRLLDFLNVAYVQFDFGESATCMEVRLLIKCGFYTRLYGK